MSMRSMLRPSTRKLPAVVVAQRRVGQTRQQRRALAHVHAGTATARGRRAVLSIWGSRLRVELSATHISEEM